MDTFTIILISVSVIFVLYYYYNQYKNWKKETTNLTWPLDYNRCPDYWTHDGNHICRNTHNLGKCPRGNNNRLQKNGTIDFKLVTGVRDTGNMNRLDVDMTKKNNLLKKCKWAKQCHTSWEGIDKLCA